MTGNNLVVEKTEDYSGIVGKILSDNINNYKIDLTIIAEEGKNKDHATHIVFPRYMNIEHGTHPCDNYGLYKFTNPAWFIDLTKTCMPNKRGYVPNVTSKLIESQVVPSGINALVIRTGYDKKLSKGDFPIFDENIAKYLKSVAPNLNVLAIDTFEMNSTKQNFNAYKSLFENHILVAKNLTNLDKLSEKMLSENYHSVFNLWTIPLLYKREHIVPARTWAELHEVPGAFDGVDDKGGDTD